MNIKKQVLKLPGVKALQRAKLRAGYRAEEKKKRAEYPSYCFRVSEKDVAPVVSVVVVGRNHSRQLQTLMESMGRCQFYDHCELLYVDRASTDASVSYMEQWNGKMKVRVIRTTADANYSASANRGAREAKGEYLLFLAPNAVVTDGWMDELLKAAMSVGNDGQGKGKSAEAIGAVGARLVYPGHAGGQKNSDKSYHLYHAGIKFREKRQDGMCYLLPYNVGNGRSAHGTAHGLVEYACVSGAVLLVSGNAFFEVGGFDERYQNEYEDADLCLKLYRAGYHNYYCADCLVYCSDRFWEDVPAIQREQTKREVVSEMEHNHIKEEADHKKSDSDKGALNHIQSDSDKGALNHIQSDSDKGALNHIQSDSDKGTDRNNQKTAARNKKKQHQHNMLLFAGRWQRYLLREIYKDASAGRFTESKLKDLTPYAEIPVNEKEIDICGAMTGDETKKFWGDQHYAVAMAKEFEKRGYKANILSRDMWYNNSSARYTIVLRGIREYYRSVMDGSVYIMWNISHPADVSAAEYNQYDYVFLASSCMQEMLRDKLQVPTGVLMQCTDPEVMKSEPGEKRYELLFVGNSRHVYRQILKDLLPTDYKLSVYGRHWEDYPVQEYVVQDYIDNNEVGQAYHDAGILLNDHWRDMKEYGIISNRIFDALSAGAFVISDEVPGMAEILSDSVVTYTDRDDLKEKIDYYMKHEDEREMRAAKGQELVRRNHTFANRVDEIVRVMEALKNKQR